jgi:hypothetical protein
MNNENFYVETFDASGINEHNSIAAHVPGDNNANNCVAGRFQNPMRHGTTADAIQNFEGRLNARPGPLNISGHGTVGYLETGSGQFGWDSRKSISLWNTGIWVPLLERLKGKSFPILSIVSCSTGAEEDGASLLWEMSKALGVPVRARTGLTSCNGGITYQAGSTWQTATPSAKPSPIPEPPHPLMEIMKKKIFFTNNNIVATESSEKIQGCKMMIASGAAEELSPKDAQQLAEIIFNNSVQEFSGQLLALVTQRLEFEMDDNGTPRIIEVDIYNDQVAVVKDSSTLYFLPPGFKMHFPRFVYNSMSVSGFVRHPLRVCKHNLASITTAEADSIIHDMSGIGAQCNISFFRQGNIVPFGSPSNGIVNSQNDFQTICSGGGILKGIVRSVYVVVKINWCGVLTPGIIGCANTPGVCMVVVRYNSSMEGQLWAHEFGHSKGLPHRDDAGAVMHSIINYGGGDFNAAECQRMRSLGLIGKLKNDGTATPNEISMNLETYINSTFIHGLPILDVIELNSRLSPEDLDSLVAVFNTTSNPLQALNIATLWSVGNHEKYFDLIKSKIDSPTDFDESYPTNCLQCDLLMSLGYLANSSEKVLNYLIETAENNSLDKATGDNSNLLLAGSINGLALSGNPAAISHLRNIQDNLSKYTTDRSMVYEAVNIAEQIRQDGIESYYRNH